jgi:hypothetical protein
MRRWFENRLAMLFAATYVAATERAMSALPHDELTRQGRDAAKAPSGTEHRRPAIRNANSRDASSTRHRQNSRKGATRDPDGR